MIPSERASWSSPSPSSAWGEYPSARPLRASGLEAGPGPTYGHRATAPYLSNSLNS